MVEFGVDVMFIGGAALGICSGGTPEMSPCVCEPFAEVDPDVDF